nr:hypothetical protein [Candidatus Cloacimonadota bacterium]
MKHILISILICLLAAQLSASGIGYALSGGGARGFAHIGILKVLEEEGIQPNYISGTSIGAVIGALRAIGYSAQEIEEIAISVDWNELMRDKVSRQELYIGEKRWAPYGNLTFELDENWKPKMPSSVFRVNSLNLKLFEIFAGASSQKDFSQFPIPFSCVATDLSTGEAHIFESGSLVQALRSSISIPSILPPFEVDGNLYIDGGIAQNLPISQVRELGADIVIGIKVNSSLRNVDELDSFVAILDQTINIGITRNLNEDLDNADLILEPDLLSYSSTDFRYVKEIIDIGEKYARENIDIIRRFFENVPQETIANSSHLDPSYDTFHITNIEIHGNQRISSTKIREYLSLETGKNYSRYDISYACRRAWNSRYFHIIYPDLYPNGDNTYILNIYVKEKEPKTLILDNSYNEEDKLTASIVLNIDNLVLKNSKLMAGIVLGGRNELNIDYVKNFGDFWGVYYRIFPYVNEKTLYGYNEDHYQIHSIQSLEYGATTGLGVFADHAVIAEFFLYYSNTSLYRGISETNMPPRRYNVSGIGFKAYHESLDNYVFPYSGVRMMSKLNIANNENVSDYVYNLFYSKIDIYKPILDDLSGQASINIGTFFNSVPEDKFDPFAIGGIDGFKGYSRYEVSAPHYLIWGLGLNFNPFGDAHLTAGIQALSYDDNEDWLKNLNNQYCYYFGFGYDTGFAPLRIQFAINKLGKLNTMLSLGYDLDPFAFSRK